MWAGGVCRTAGRPRPAEGEAAGRIRAVPEGRERDWEVLSRHTEGRRTRGEHLNGAVACRGAYYLPWGRKYEHPQGRGAFVATTLREFLPGNVLDVGSGRSSEGLKASLGNAYHALDLASSYQFRRPAANTAPDAVVDLERGELPFDDKAFDTVICTDVLEHIDNIYRVHDELFRVARRYVIISLPNNWPNLFGSFLIGRNITHHAGYGLTPQPKPHGQRHKYFFNFEEACEFLGGRVPAGFRVCRFEQRLSTVMTDYCVS